MSSKLLSLLVVLAVFGLWLPSCNTRDEVAQPSFENGGLLRDATPLPDESLALLAALYSPSGDATFGTDPIVGHAAYGGTLSLFAQPNAAYAVLRAGCLDGGTKVVLEGKWRQGSAFSTGLVRLFVSPSEVAAFLCRGRALDAGAPRGEDLLSSPIRLEGTIGGGGGEPRDSFVLTRTGPLRDMGGFAVAAHHGACRTIDECGASENTRESIRMAQSFGASVVEIDVRLSKEGLPVLFHDDNFGPRLTNGPFCHGPVSDFNLANMRAVCKLKYGEEIPTLAEALETVLTDTRLSGVWIDTKIPEAVQPTLDVMATYRARAAELGRKLSIVIGLGDDDILEAYRAAMKAPGTECLVELEKSDVIATGCQYWGPRWTRGPIASEVAELQALGKKVVYWTINEPEFMDLFLSEGKPDGMLSDRPGVVFNKMQMLKVAEAAKLR